ncbi:MAG: hypothetical protein IJ708_07760 [Clostridia bacterium]|nr:hypothetical protein [Clostridia bacterium]
MKPIAIILALAVMILGTLGLYLYLTCQVSIVSISPASVEASTQKDLFQTLLAQADAEALTGSVYLPDLSLFSSDDDVPYMFVTYHIDVRNTGFLPATSLEVEIAPRQGDVVQLLDTTERMLPAQSEGILDAVLLTQSGVSTAREVRLTYYLWGLPFTLKVISP